MNKILASGLCFALAGCLVLGGCGEKEETAETEAVPENNSEVIKIGLLESFTGAYAEGAAEEISGVEFAHDERPSVTIGGKEYNIELIEADDKSGRHEAAEAAEGLIENEDVTAILGSYSSVPSLGAADVIKEYDTPAVGISCTALGITEGNDRYFRVCFTDSFQGAVMAGYAYNTLAARNIDVIYDAASDYSSGLAYYFINEFKALAGEEGSVKEITYQTGDTDFTAQIEAAGGEEPDCFFIPGNYTEAALLIKQLRKSGFQAPVLSGDSIESKTFSETGGDEVNGTIFSAFFDPASETGSKTDGFIESYKEAKGAEPLSSAALGYDAYMLICDSLESCGSIDKNALREELSKAEYEGVTGAIAFDENGNPSKPAVIKKVNTETQGFDFVTLITAE